ncbi:MAG: NPCBM/NEW2 domain-containing protein [Bacteroidota bacterium]|nr:NPCBM/NEW2 domain-containing protein [Bacteroidota bacterium]
MKRWLLSLSVLIVFVAVHDCVQAQPKTFHLSLRTRDPQTNRVMEKAEYVDASKIGIVIVDPWNYHWCMTWTEQAGGMAPRMNRANECVRRLGMQIFWAPTDVANMYSAWPQRQRAMAVPYVEVPRVRDYTCNFTVPEGPCLCGPGIECKTNYGWDGINPDLHIAGEDLIVAGTKELYSLCKARGITHLIYFGGATNLCLTGKPEGISFMYGAGLETIFARDLSFAMTTYDPAKSYTPTSGNTQATDDLERAGIPTVSFVDELRKQGLWNEKWITEPVRITPAGTVNRPYFFENTVTVSLDAPYLPDAVIRFTLDGTEPGATSPRYNHTFVLQKTTTLRTAAFRKDKKVSLDGRAFFVLLPPLPPAPDISVTALEPVTDLYAAMNPVYAACLWQPVTNKSYEGKTLRIREKTFGNGLGMRAPAYIRFNLKPGWKRFVARAGIDDNMLDKELGRNIAMYSKIIFKIFVDGRLAAESPVMRISQEPWRFNVAIPAGSRQIVLVCDDMGNRSPYNLGNWVDAGFCME